MSYTKIRPVRRWLPALLIAASLLTVIQPARAQDGLGAPPRIVTEPGGVAITWSGGPTAETAAAAARTSLPVLYYQGYNLPLQMIALTVAPGAAPGLQVNVLEAVELPGGVAPSAPEAPPVLDWEPDPNLPALITQLPTAPIFVAREGKLDGRHVVVLALSPFYQDGNVVKVATNLNVFVPGAVPNAEIDEPSAAGEESLGAAAAAEPVAVPRNADALRQAVKLIVDRPGIFEVLFSELGGVPNPAGLRLTRGGSEVALEVLADRLRFFVPAVGDRWNTTSVYWLTANNKWSANSSPAHIVTAPAAPAGSPGQAFERGLWRESRFYNSVYAGPDGDRWFYGDLQVDITIEAPSFTIPLTPTLPPVGGPTCIDVALTAFRRPAVPIDDINCNKNPGYWLEATVAGAKPQVAKWSPGCIVPQNSVQSFTYDVTATSVRLRLLYGGYPAGIKLDSVAWERPVQLNFSQRAGDFWTQPGAWTFAIAAPPAQWQLYDVTAPLRPTIVPRSGNNFNQSASATVARHYWVANLAQPQKPAIQNHTAVNFGAVKAANALYIGPRQFEDELQPLIQLRRSQGFKPIFVDIQSIFDAYGYGHVSPSGLRNFLRNQTDWQNPTYRKPYRRIAVTLAGDGTYDPHNYEGKDVAGKIFSIPAYMADVDSYILEAACEPCFAQLNGDDPLTGDGDLFAADIWLGRLPARNEGEITALVNKIVAYETRGSDLEAWRRRTLLLADNYIKSINEDKQAIRDDAGDFPVFADQVQSLYQMGSWVDRIYYDPVPDRRIMTTPGGAPMPVPGNSGLFLTEPRSPAESWRTSDPIAANSQAKSIITEGAGLVIYNGHSHHWQYARTTEDPSAPVQWFLDLSDAAVYLQNSDRYFIGLAMTCYTSQFPKPANAGTLDELLLRNPNAGAVAIFGPAGTTVAHGHDYLQKGFIGRLRTTERMNLRLGELVEAGFTNLLLNGSPFYFDSLKTFLLLGDPLTRARVSAGSKTGLFLPLIER